MKNKNKIKVISILVLGIAISTSFVGCGKNSESTDENENNTSGAANNDSFIVSNNESTADKTTQNANLVTGNTVTFGNYEQDNDLSNGAEDVEWTVIDEKDGKVLLLSVYLLDSKPFHNERVGITWEDCSLREWLNDDFYNTAFDGSEKSKISIATIDNTTNGYTVGGNDTEDNVFILSRDEIDDYRLDMNVRNGYATEYALEQGCDALEDENTSCWWIRTMGGTVSEENNLPNGAYEMEFDGSFGRPHVVDSLHNGIRPCVWVTLDSSDKIISTQ